MSLFGGSASQLSDDDNSQATVTPSWYSAAEIPSLGSTQPAQETEQLLRVDSDDSYDSGSDIEDEESEAEQLTRPNRFIGPPQTWRGYTDFDRQIAASLDQIQDSDLAIHLYNAHALKRRVLRPAKDIANLKNWQPRYTWIRSDEELYYTDQVSGLEQKELVPPKEWTAWPQHPRRLKAQRPEWVDGDLDQWMVGAAKALDAGEELREEALAMFLRLAKDKWRSRRGGGRAAVSQQKTATSIGSERLASQTNNDKEDGNQVGSNEGNGHKGTVEPPENDEDRQDHTASKKRGRPPKVFTFTKAAIMADDMKAQTLLLPTINSMLSQLDDLASAVRRTRKNHVGLLSDERLSSRPQSKAGSKSAMSRNSSTRLDSRATSGRRQIRTEEGDSESDRSTPDRAASNGTFQKRKRQSATNITSRKRSRVPLGTKENLMDWSEVLGLAAVIGWDQGAIARTAQRCATLFGESMSFTPFDESAALNPVAEPVRYIPSTIPAPDVVSIVKPSVPKRPFFQLGTTCCPHTDCYSYGKDYHRQKDVVRHCVRVHGYDPRTNDSDNEERKFGGVHVDGFLQPVTAKRGWLGPGRERARVVARKPRASNKSKKVEEKDEDEDMVASDAKREH